MLKWLLTLIVALIVLNLCAPRLRRLGLGRLPGDIVWRHGGRDYYLPITSTVLLSLAFTLLLRLI